MITEPIALDKSLNTTDTNPKNVADVLQKGLNDIKNAIGGGGGGGGHTIVNSDGQDMPQEDAMQFLDAHLTDDSINGRTVVENVKEVASADYPSETEDGMYLIPDGEGAVIEPASDDKVEVTADGVKTYATLLNEIAGNTDFSKVIDNAYLTSETVSGARNVFVLRAHSNSYATFFHGTSENAGSKIRTYHITPNGSLYEESVGASYSDKSTDKPSNGTKLTLYYGNKKATVDLQTTANRCWYDSENTVKQKIDGLATSGIWTHTVTATEAGSSVIYASPNNIKAGAKKLIPTGCIVGSQTKPCVYDNDNNLFIIFGMNTNDTVTIYFVAIM